ncbi:hypothetical protein [Micromonospora luteifusca]|uniref:hypothetical protein n=1 Tax=Micromonospora luteifusca TaxID=709860 RepID=UPI0033A5E05B
MTRRTTLILVAVATAVVVLLGCGVYATARVLLRKPPAAVAADVVGNWSGTDDVALTLNPDHTFEARNLPVNIQAPSRFSAPYNGSGEWRLSAPDRYRSQHVSVEIDGYGIPLTLNRSNNRTRLYLTDLDEGGGRRYWFDKD